jgi:hypothetical protein
MRNKFLISLLFLVGFLGCKKNEPPFCSVKSVHVNNEGEFLFSNNLTYSVIDKKNYQLRITTEPENSDVYYSFNDGELHPLEDYWINVHSGINHINFYSSSEKKSSENYCLYLGYGQNNLISPNIFPNPFSDTVLCQIESKTRGTINLSVLDVSGKELDNASYFIDKDSVNYTRSLNLLPSGIYFFKVEYGNTEHIYKLAKQ